MARQRDSVKVDFDSCQAGQAVTVRAEKRALSPRNGSPSGAVGHSCQGRRPRPKPRAHMAYLSLVI